MISVLQSEDDAPQPTTRAKTLPYPLHASKEVVCVCCVFIKTNQFDMGET